MVVVAVIGGSEEEELTAGTGIETLARRLCQRSKAVVLEDNLREASVKGSPHDGTLSRRHRGRHQDSTLTAESQSFCLLSLYLLVGETPRALYLHMERFAEEEDVALCRERHAFPRQRALHTEEVRVLTLDEEPAGVVGKIAFPVVELARTEEHLVVVVEFEEDAGVFGFTIGIGVLTLHSSVVESGEEGLEGVSAAGLEAVEDITEMKGEAVGDEEDGMEVVGHELEGDALQLRETGEHALPVVNDGVTEGCRHRMGRVRIAIGLVHVAHDVTKEGQATLRDHRYQVDTAGQVVVTFHSARHRVFLVTGEKLPSSSCFFIHVFRGFDLQQR